MPDPDRLLRTLLCAADALRRQPGRQGRLIDLPVADDILVTGDMHGNIGNFETIYRKAQLTEHPRRHLILQEVIHGKFRYPLGGDKSHQILDLFCALKNQFPERVHLLMGNHELSQWTNRSIIKADEDLNELFVRGIMEAYGEKGTLIYESYKALFALLPMAIRTSNRIFLSHSIPSAKHGNSFSLEQLRKDDLLPEDVAPRGIVYSILWGRDVSMANVHEFLNKVDCDWLITGHIPAEQGFVSPNDRQFILDTCASPAAYALLRADRPLTREEILNSIHLI